MEECLIAPCGINCAVCVKYLAMKNEINKKGFRKSYCPGCLPRGKNCTHIQCELLIQGKVRYCYECSQFPCSRLKNLDKRYSTKYHLSVVENLNCIREQGMKAFLKREEEKWKCQDCDGEICCHNGICFQCNLDKLRLNKRYCWED